MDDNKKAKLIDDGFELYGHHRQPCDTDPNTPQPMICISHGATFDLSRPPEINGAVLTISTKDGLPVLRVDLDRAALLHLFKVTRAGLSKLPYWKNADSDDGHQGEN